MKKSYFAGIAIVVVALLLLLVFSGAFYTVDQTEQVIITQFGQPVGDPITDPGLHFKIPIVQSVNSLDKRFLEWDGAPVAIPTRDKTYIHVDTFARWRIDDPKTYFVRLHDERSALSRLDDILGSETRNSIAKHDLIEIVRSTTRLLKAVRPARSAFFRPSSSAGRRSKMKSRRRPRKN
jgi:membrane protease subunit HflC